MHRLEKEIQLVEMLEEPSLTNKEREKLQIKIALLRHKNEKVSNRPFNIVLFIMILSAIYVFLFR